MIVKPTKFFPSNKGEKRKPPKDKRKEENKRQQMPLLMLLMDDDETPSRYRLVCRKQAVIKQPARQGH